MVPFRSDAGQPRASSAARILPLLLLALLCILALAAAPTQGAHLQLGAPASGHVCVAQAELIYLHQHAAGAFQDISGLGTTVDLDGDRSARGMELGFDDPFPYFATSFTEVNMHENGFLWFTGTAGAAPSVQELPDTTAPNSVVAPYWGAGFDTEPLTRLGALHADHITIGGMDVFVAQWTRVEPDNPPFHHSQPPGAWEYTFQAQLYENGTIMFFYDQTPTTTTSVMQVSIGLEGPDGLLGGSLSSPAQQAGPLAGQGYRFDRVGPDPYANDISYDARFELPLTVGVSDGVLQNDGGAVYDIAPDCLPFEAVLETAPANGGLVLNDDGSFTYTPDPGFEGTDSFTYRALEGSILSDPATVTIDVLPLAVLADNTYDILQDHTLEVDDVNVPGTQSNDIVTPGESVVLVVDSPPSLGNLNDSATSTPILAGDPLGPGGTFHYTPDPFRHGQDTFTYRACDVNDLTRCTPGTTTVTIDVLHVNNRPTITALGSLTIPEATLHHPNARSELWATGVTPGPFEPLQTLTTTVTNDNNPLFQQQPTLTVHPNGEATLDFTLQTEATGTATLTITLQDDGGTATVTDSHGNSAQGQDTITLTTQIVVVPVNHPPTITAGPDLSVLMDLGPVTTSWGTGITPGRPSEAAQTLTATLTPADPTLFTATGQPQLTWNPNGDGTLTFTPAPGTHGATTITLTLKDDGDTQFGGQDTTTLDFVLQLLHVNQPPEATFDDAAIQVSHDAGPQTRQAWIRDILPGPPFEHASQSVTSVALVDVDGPEGLFAAPPQLIDIDLQAGTADLVFEPQPGTDGTITLTIRIKDDGGQDVVEDDLGNAVAGIDHADFTATITVVAAPEAVDDAFHVFENTTDNILDVLANDFHVGGLPLSIQSFTQPGKGSLTQDGDVLRYTPEADWAGSTAFTYTAATPAGSTATATATITVEDPPTPLLILTPGAHGDPHCAGEDVAYLAEARYKDHVPTQWQWSDGTTTGQAAAAGAFLEFLHAPQASSTLTLTVTFNGGATAQKSHTLQVRECVPPAPSFSLERIEGRTVHFRDTSTHPAPDAAITAWHWDFDDGSTSTQQHPVHTFQGGLLEFTVTLTVTDEHGIHTARSGTVRLPAPGPVDTPSTPQAPPTQTPTQQPPEETPTETTPETPLLSVHAPASVRSGDRVTMDASGSSVPAGAVAFWDWTQDAGPPVDLDSTARTTASFTAPDVAAPILLRFTVTLDVPGHDPITDDVQVEVRPLPAQPTVDLVAEALPGAPQTLRFHAQGTGIVSATWDFGDGSPASHLRSPVHTYLEDGTYTVRLDVTWEDGSTAHSERQVVVASTPTPVDLDLEPVDDEEEPALGSRDDAPDQEGRLVWPWAVAGAVVLVAAAVAAAAAMLHRRQDGQP